MHTPVPQDHVHSPLFRESRAFPPVAGTPWQVADCGFTPKCEEVDHRIPFHATARLRAATHQHHVAAQQTPVRRIAAGRSRPSQAVAGRSIVACRRRREQTHAVSPPKGPDGHHPSPRTRARGLGVPHWVSKAKPIPQTARVRAREAVRIAPHDPSGHPQRHGRHTPRQSARAMAPKTRRHRSGDGVDSGPPILHMSHPMGTRTTSVRCAAVRPSRHPRPIARRRSAPEGSR